MKPSDIERWRLPAPLRKLIRRAFENRCCWCGKRGQPGNPLEIAHITNFPDTFHDVTDGLTFADDLPERTIKLIEKATNHDFHQVSNMVLLHRVTCHREFDQLRHRNHGAYEKRKRDMARLQVETARLAAHNGVYLEFIEKELKLAYSTHRLSIMWVAETLHHVSSAYKKGDIEAPPSMIIHPSRRKHRAAKFYVSIEHGYARGA